MGFFIGWEYFEESDRYSFAARKAQSDFDDKQRAKNERAERKRRKVAEKKRKAKKAQREQWNQEALKYEEEVNKRYGSQSKVEQMSENTDFSKYTDQKNTKGYLEEVTSRYSKSYYSSMDQQNAPGINRGFGYTSNKQQINGENQKYKRVPKLGALGAGAKKHVDFNQFNNQNQNNQKKGSLTNESLTGGGFGKVNSSYGGKLTRGGF
jgi:small-conductance mechanosensitive channel